jgi:FtsH-binding integral membrane protein
MNRMLTSGKINVSYDQYGNSIDTHTFSLKEYMQKIYNVMILGLSTSALSALLITYTSLGGLFLKMVNHQVELTGLGAMAVFSPILLVVAIGFFQYKENLNLVRFLYYTFAIIEGVSIAGICSLYNVTTIMEAFFVSISLFVSMNIYGYSTNRNLDSLGNFFFAGLIAVILVSIINLFIHSTGLNFIIPYLGVFVFLGLTAYQTQNIKANYLSLGRDGFSDKSLKTSIYYNALSFYLDILNIFLFLLRILGGSGYSKK